MWTQASAPPLLLLLLLACSAWTAAEAQRRSVWGDPITFTTKAKDLCAMTVTGQGEHTRLRLSCQSGRRSYWCQYVGKPHTCRPYTKNPRHYFVQMMWGLRKLQNACQAPRLIKPHMCRKATDDSRMVFSSSSFHAAAESTTSVPARAHEPTPPVESSAKKAARQYCWRSLHRVCSFFIGLFRRE